MAPEPAAQRDFLASRQPRGKPPGILHVRHARVAV